MKVLFQIFIAVLMVGMLAFVSGCADDSSGKSSKHNGNNGSNQNPTDPGNNEPQNAGTSPSSVAFSAPSPDVVTPGQISTISVTVLDSNGNPVNTGTEVIFSLQDSQYGTLDPVTVNTDATGVATTTFTANNEAGQAVISATSGGVTAPTPASVTISVSATPASVVFSTPNPEVIIAEKTSTISVTVLNRDGNPVDPGTEVSFSLQDSQYGTLEPATADTNAVGVATTTFTANNEAGEAVIRAASGGTSAVTPARITISGSAVATIQFVSTSAYVIAIRESGGTSMATVSFSVHDNNNNPVAGKNVEFSLTGPNGGEYINEDPDDPINFIASTDKDGVASVILSSGYVAGPATINASVRDDDGNPFLSINSPVVSIGGGVPTQKRFTVAAPVLNVPGLYTQNHKLEISAYMADRFGNYNVLNGLSVSFSPEMGLAAFSTDISCDGLGIATAKVRTHQTPEDVAPNEIERALMDELNANYFVDGHELTSATFNNPRDGICSILVYAKGEEHFVDKNANGIYDNNDTFVDTNDDPFCDYNDSGFHTDDPEDSGTDDEYELYIDSNKNGLFDTKNNQWDNDKFIFRNFNILSTGVPMIMFKDASFEGNDQDISFIVCDRNFNTPIAGTKIKVTTDLDSGSDGTIKGDTEIIINDTNRPTKRLGDIEYSVYLSNMSAGRGDVFVEVEWNGFTIYERLSGEIPEETP